MPADHDVVISLPAESARYDRRLRSIGTLDEFELIRHLFLGRVDELTQVYV